MSMRKVPNPSEIENRQPSTGEKVLDWPWTKRDESAREDSDFLQSDAEIVDFTVDWTDITADFEIPGPEEFYDLHGYLPDDDELPDWPIDAA